MRRSIRGDLLAFAAAAALALLLRAPLAAIPLERDEGEYAYIAQRWLLGEVPYKDAFDQKPPGTFLAYAAILRLVGSSPAAIHWGAQLYSLGTLAVVFALARRLSSPAAAFAAATFTAFLIGDRPVLGNAANTETFMILPLAGALLAVLLAIDRDAPWLSALAGVASATAILFKQVGMANVACLAIVLLWRARRPRSHLIGLGAGVLAGILPVLAYFALAGAWREFADCVVGHNVHYAAARPLSSYPGFFWAVFSKILAGAWPIYGLAAVGTVAAWRTARRIEVQTILGWALASFVGMSVGGYYREHYFIQWVPAVALLAGIGVSRFGRMLSYAVTLGAVLVGVVTHASYYAPADPIDKAREIYGGNPFAVSPEVGRFVAESSAPDDRVFIFGSEPQILFYARRKSATRYIFVYPLLTPFADTRSRQREVLDELERTPPKLIVTVMVPTSFLPTAEAVSGPFVSGVLDLVAARYRLVAVAPFRDGDRTEWLTGDVAREAWDKRPPPSQVRYWAALAVWEAVR